MSNNTVVQKLLVHEHTVKDWDAQYMGLSMALTLQRSSVSMNYRSRKGPTAHMVVCTLKGGSPIGSEDKTGPKSIWVSYFSL